MAPPEPLPFGARASRRARVEDGNRQLHSRSPGARTFRVALVVNVRHDVAERGKPGHRDLPLGHFDLPADDGHVVVPVVPEIAQPLQQAEPVGRRLAGAPKRCRHEDPFPLSDPDPRRTEKRQRADQENVRVREIPLPQIVEGTGGIDYR